MPGAVPLAFCIAVQVWIAVGNKEKVEAQEFFFRFDRRRNIEMTAIAAMNKLRLFMLNNK